MKWCYLRAIFADSMLFFAKNYFPTQNLLSDAECKTCKYKWLIISINTFALVGLKWLRGTVGGRKICKNLQMKLPSKIKYTNICKDVFPVLCIFTFVNTDFWRFLQILAIRCEASEVRLPFFHLGIFIIAVLCISL